MEEKKELKFDVKRLFNYEKLHEYDEDGQKGFLGYLIREEQWKIENDRIVFPNIVNVEQIKNLLDKFENIKKSEIPPTIINNIKIRNIIPIANNTRINNIN